MPTPDDMMFGPRLEDDGVVVYDRGQEQEYRQAVVEFNDSRAILELMNDARFLLLLKALKEDADRLDKQYLEFEGTPQQREQLFEQRMRAKAPIQKIEWILNAYRGMAKPVWGPAVPPDWENRPKQVRPPQY